MSGVVERAAAKLLEDAVRRQVNSEAVAAKTIERLADEPPTIDAERSIDGVWMASFVARAAEADEEAVRELWAKILASEILRPGTSLRTLERVSLMTPGEAELAMRLFKFVMNGEFVPCWVLEGPNPVSLDELLLLEEIGLLRRNLNWGAEAGAEFTHGGEGITAPQSMNFPIVSLTLPGRDLCRIVAGQASDPELFRAFFVAQGAPLEKCIVRSINN